MGSLIKLRITVIVGTKMGAAQKTSFERSKQSLFDLRKERVLLKLKTHFLATNQQTKTIMPLEEFCSNLAESTNCELARKIRDQRYPRLTLTHLKELVYSHVKSVTHRTYPDEIDLPQELPSKRPTEPGLSNNLFKRLKANFKDFKADPQALSEEFDHHGSSMLLQLQRLGSDLKLTLVN